MNRIEVAASPEHIRLSKRSIELAMERGQQYLTPEFIIRKLRLRRNAACAVLDLLLQCGAVDGRVEQGYPISTHWSEALTDVHVLDEQTSGPAPVESGPAASRQGDESDPEEAERENASGESREAAAASGPLMVSLDLAVVDQFIQPREALDPRRVQEYVDAMQARTVFPPITLFRDPDGSLLLADGFHRYAAAKAAGLDRLPAVVRKGDRREALLYAIQINSVHGLPLSLSEKRQAAVRLLNDSEWGRWSDSEIARRCGLSHPTVAKLRQDPNLKIFQDAASAGRRRYRRRDGRQTEINVSKIGSRRRSNPEKSREAAKRTVLPESTNGGLAGQEPAAAVSPRPQLILVGLEDASARALQDPDQIAYEVSAQPILAVRLREQLTKVMELLTGDVESASAAPWGTGR